MINVICAKTLRVFKEDQKKLLGLSLLCVLMSAVIMILSGAVPIIGISIVLVILAGMRTIFFAAYQKKKISSDMLFLGFNDLKHVCGGMLWMFFKVTVWLLIPVVGIFFAISKAYEYRFVPYILITRPEIRGIDATEVSSRETDGFKANMFYADAIIIGTVAVLKGAYCVNKGYCQFRQVEILDRNDLFYMCCLLFRRSALCLRRYWRHWRCLQYFVCLL